MERLSVEQQKVPPLLIGRPLSEQTRLCLILGRVDDATTAPAIMPRALEQKPRTAGGQHPPPMRLRLAAGVRSAPAEAEEERRHAIHAHV